MVEIKSFIAEIKSRGQLTIPKKVREMTGLEEGEIVNIIPVGDSIVVTPRRLEIEEARRQIKKILKATKVPPEDVLKSLLEERKSLYNELYGKKKG